MKRRRPHPAMTVVVCLSVFPTLTVREDTVEDEYSCAINIKLKGKKHQTTPALIWPWLQVLANVKFNRAKTISK